MAHKIEVFYTGGGIHLAQADLEGDQYAVVNTEAPEYLAIYKREDGEETYLPEDMVASLKPEDMDPEMLELHAEMVEQLNAKA